MSLPLLLALLAGAPSSATAQCPSSDVQFGARVGPQSSATTVEAFVDPVARNALSTVLQIRRWVAERPGEVGVRIRLAHLGNKLDPRGDRVRLWVAAMAAEGQWQPALRIVRRDGIDRTFVRLATAAGREELAEALGLLPDRHERIAAGRCHRLELARARVDVTTQMRSRGTSVFRLPVFAVGDLTFEDSGSLDRLRPALGALRVRARKQLERRPPTPPIARPRSDRMHRPQLRGAMLGGVGLPHVFVLMARDEEDPVLWSLLPPLLTYRHAQPGRLAVQVVARGLAVEHGLRQRLCAAEAEGLVPAYLAYLSIELTRRHLDPAAEALLAALDRSEAVCELDRDDDEETLPMGGWLDGSPTTRNELDRLGPMLDALDRLRRPLHPFLQTEGSDPEGPEGDSEPSR